MINISKKVEKLKSELAEVTEHLSYLVRQYKLAARAAKTADEVLALESQWQDISVLYEEIKPAYEFIAEEAKFSKQAVKGPLKLELATWRR